MSIEALLTDLAAALRENTAAIKANGGNNVVNSPASEDSDKLKKATWFHLVDKKQVVKVEAGGERPLGGSEVTAAEAKKLEEKYKADVAKNSTQTGATGGAAQAASSSSTGAQSGSQSSDGPTFQDVTDAISALAKKKIEDGGGREKVVALFKLWGVERFPEVSGKKPNAELLADIKKAGEPVKKEEPAEDDMSALGL